MARDMDQINQDIKNQSFMRCYLLCGEEDYLRLQFKNDLICALVAKDDMMNYHKFSGKNIDIAQIIECANSMPFFADKRVILIEDSGLCKSGGEKLAEYLPESQDTSVIIMVESEVDKRSKLYKAFNANGRVCEFTTQNENTLRAWIRSKVKKEGKQIDDSALLLMLERTGTDMMTISTELEKLFSYTHDKTIITVSDIQDIVTVSTSNKVFDMITAMAQKETAKALELYHDLLSHKATPIGMLILIIRQFNQLLQIKELREQGFISSQIATKLGLNPYVERKCEAQARGFSLSRIRQILEACIKADEDVKINSQDPILCVELLIIEYSK